MDKIIVFVISVALIIAIILIPTWCVWVVWCWVLPQVWPTGPAGLIEPSFWLFYAMFFLLSVIGRIVSGDKAGESK